MKRILTILFVLVSLLSYSQGKVVRCIVIGNDTTPIVYLPSVSIGASSPFVSKKESAQYKKLKRDVKKVYPYAKIAGDKLKNYESELTSLDKDKDKRKLMKQVESELKDEYGDELKKLTVTQGKILLKLIDRETGETSYELVKELRGSLSAVFWQTMARVVGSSLKVNYDPQGEDKEIEDIIILIEKGLL